MKRSIYHKLIEWKQADIRKPLILLGARQVGKTYILKEFTKENFENTCYLNFEEEPQLSKAFDGSLNPTRVLEDLSLLLGYRIETENSCLIFDEIQHCARALTSLKYFQEKMPQVAILAAGSLLGLQLGESSFPVGKVQILKMHPLSFLEFLDGIGDFLGAESLRSLPKKKQLSIVQHDHLWKKFKLYLITGGMPEAVVSFHDNQDSLIDAFNETREVHKNLLLAYEADIAKHAGKTNSMHIQRVWRSVPEQLSRAHDESAPKFKFAGAVPGVRGYIKLSRPIDWLTASGLVTKVPIANYSAIPLSAYTKENYFKLFILDTGLLVSLCRIPYQSILDYDYGSYKGFIAENVVAELLSASGEEGLIAWKEKESELEFLITSGNSIIPIEVKSGRNIRARSLSIYSKKYNPKQVVILSSKILQFDSHTIRVPLYATELLTKLID